MESLSANTIDTNHLERALRAVPMGRKAWLFNWTEVGAKYVGIVNSLIVTCRLHQIDPYDYLVDVLQRIGDLRISDQRDRPFRHRDRRIRHRDRSFR